MIRVTLPIHGLPIHGARLALGWALVVGLVLIGVACDDEDASVPATAPAVTATTTADAQAIRRADFTSVGIVGELSDRAGAAGQVTPERVHFEDLTGDGVEEAVVILESGGTLGDLGAGVYQAVNGEPVLAFFVNAGGHVEVRAAVVVTQEGVYAAGDAECCPSQLREISYGWNGTTFVELSDEVVDSPAR